MEIIWQEAREDPTIMKGRESLLLSTRYLLKLVKELAWADVVHWYAGKVYLPFQMDLKLVKIFSKARLVEWAGSEIRLPEREAEENPYLRSSLIQVSLRRRITR